MDPFTQFPQRPSQDREAGAAATAQLTAHTGVRDPPYAAPQVQQARLRRLLSLVSHPLAESGRWATQPPPLDTRFATLAASPAAVCAAGLAAAAALSVGVIPASAVQAHGLLRFGGARGTTVTDTAEGNTVDEDDMDDFDDFEEPEVITNPGCEPEVQEPVPTPRAPAVQAEDRPPVDPPLAEVPLAGSVGAVLYNLLSIPRVANAPVLIVPAGFRLARVMPTEVPQPVPAATHQRAAAPLHTRPGANSGTGRGVHHSRAPSSGPYQRTPPLVRGAPVAPAPAAAMPQVPAPASALNQAAGMNNWPQDWIGPLPMTEATPVFVSHQVERPVLLPASRAAQAALLGVWALSALRLPFSEVPPIELPQAHTADAAAPTTSGRPHLLRPRPVDGDATPVPSTSPKRPRRRL